MKRYLLFVLLLAFFVSSFSQRVWTTVVPDSVIPNAAWETGYLQRREHLLTADTWTSRSSRGDEDNGKRYWPLLLGEMYLKRNNQADVDALVLDGSRGGHSGIYGTYEGSFYKPFSCPGYAFYYFTYYDRITAVDNVQHTQVQSMWNSPNRGYTCRTDGKMDPIYFCSEFNSENFCWMARIGGYLLSHHFNDVTIIPDGNKPAMTYYTDWVNNWVRATFCAGRVEYESHIYFPFCFQAVAALQQFAKDSMKRLQGRAVMDWLVAEAAIRYLDGHMVGPESRNKNGGIVRLDGSGIGYYYLYFVDDAHPITDVPVDTVRAWYKGDLHTSGFIGHMNYRPAQVIVDIAQRKFNTPVEIRSAKPFYHLDNANYTYWNGLNTKSRRYEFETYYLERNYTLGSMASGRPKGVDCFWEQCVWRLGVKGLKYQVFGNSGSIANIGGRCEYEQIGQLRNVMMRLFRGNASASNMWVALPDIITNKELDGSILFADLGTGVYMAVMPYNTGAVSTASFIPVTGVNYTKYTWAVTANAFAGLILEVGTAEQHSSYANFKNQIKNNTVLTSPEANQLQYVSTLGNTLKMEHTGTTKYTYTLNNCDTSTIDPAGKYPRIWYNGVETDFNTWNVYEVVYGDTIIDCKWSGGTLFLKSNENKLKIIVDTATANVYYQKILPEGEVKTSSTEKLYVNKMTLMPNPAKDYCKIEIMQDNAVSVMEISLLDNTGRRLKQIFAGQITGHKWSTDISLSALPKGIYTIRLLSGNRTETQKLIVQ